MHARDISEPRRRVPGSSVPISSQGREWTSLLTRKTCLKFLQNRRIAFSWSAFYSTSGRSKGLLTRHSGYCGGGIIYVNVPFILAYHQDPEDFNRFSVPGLDLLCSCFCELPAVLGAAPASTFVDLLIRFLGYCSPLTASRYTRQNVYCGKWAAFWIKYFDIVIAHHSVADIMWGSPYFFGRKPLSSEQLSTDGKYQL